MNKKRLVISILLLIAAGIVAWLLIGNRKKHKVTFDTTVVAKSNLNTFVTATGTVEPITKVEVGTQVSGIVDKIYVDFNSPVKRGQILAELDKTNLLNELASRKSNVATSKVEYEYQLNNYNRMKTLHDQQLISENDYELAYHNYEQAKNSYDISKNDLAKAQTNLGFATIFSPIDGVVLSKVVEEGQTVAASFNTPTLFTIAQDLTQMQVVANVDEADIGEIADKQRVDFTVDAYPNDMFQGRVTQVRQEATVTNNVVTYEVVINSPNPDLKLKPGLTANVTIYTLEKNDILTVPAKALRFIPEPTLLNPENNIQDVQAPHKLWALEGNTLRAYPVEIGATNGAQTEITSGIPEGTEVIVDAKVNAAPNNRNQSTETSPFMPSRPGGRR